jgi:glutaminase
MRGGGHRHDSKPHRGGAVNFMDYQDVLEEIVTDVRPLLALGRVADYIPRLAEVPKSRFGMALQTVEGDLFCAGDAIEAFSIQSISKVYTLTMALRSVGDSIWERIQREPSGDPFNSLVLLERECGVPRNPFINAGAIVMTDILLSCTPNPTEELIRFVQLRSGNTSIQSDVEVAASEKACGFRNAALANFLKSFGNLQNPVEKVLDFYYQQCSLAMNCVDLAKSFLFLANGGRCPWTGERILDPSPTKRVNALMLTCGTYDAVGDFVYRVGLPAKSGIGGGIAAVFPGRFAVAVWSPGLNPKGNSLAGTQALELFTTKTRMSIF